MSFAQWLGGAFDPQGQRRAVQANKDLTTSLNPASAYWQSGQLTGDEDILKGAAGLNNTNIGLDTSAMDADGAALGQLGNTYNDIAQNGGRLTEATKRQAQSDVANTATGQLMAADRNASQVVRQTDASERQFAGEGANQTRFAQLANQLKKQAWNTAITHANFEARLAGQGIQNQDTNLAMALAEATKQGAAGARIDQRGISNAMSQQDMQNALAIGQAALSAGGQVTSGIAGMAKAAEDVSGTANKSAAVSNPSAQAKVALPKESYVNPVSGATTNANLPSSTASWGDWLINGSTLVG